MQFKKRWEPWRKITHEDWLHYPKEENNLLSEVGMLDCKPMGIPTEQNQKLDEKGDQVPTNKSNIKD
ncbi:hypothetical protein CR513_24412, partial [Mucuna pruriens]